MTKKRIFVKFLCLFLAGVLFLCVGCSGDVAETEKAGTVRFISGSAESSREMFVSDTIDCDADSLYWAYVAVKKDGLHTTGESEKATSPVAGVSVEAESGKFYKLRPVKSPLRGLAEKGLDADVGSFAYGDWLFKIYGYSGYDSATKVFSGLMYTGDTIGLTRVNSDTNSVGFKMSNATDYPADGNLAFGSLYFTVPQNMKLYKNSKVTVTFTEGSSNTIATATGTVGDSGAATGTKVWLSVGSISSVTEHRGKNGKFAPNTYNFTIKIEYTKSSETTGDVDDEITTSTLKSFPVIFNAGITTLLYGNVNDINVDNGVGADSGVPGSPSPVQHPNADFGIVVATTGSGTGLVEYTNLADAMAAKTTVTLVRDIEYGGSIKPLAATTINLNGHFIRNLTIESGSFALTFSTGSGTYAFTSAGGKVNNLSYSGNTVWLDTTGGAITVNSTSGNVYHTGTASSVTVTACANDKAGGLGYHCGLSTVSTLTVAKGFADLGSYSNITTLTVATGNAANVELRGTVTTVVGNINAIRDAAYNASTTKAFTKVVLKANGGTGSDVNTWGIDGMYMNLKPYMNGTTAMFTRPAAQYFIGWTEAASECLNRMADGDFSALIDDSVKYLVSGDLNRTLFAIWSNKLVGGTIFYIHPETAPTASAASDQITGNADGTIMIDDVTYRFYDKNGKPMNLSGGTYQRQKNNDIFTVSGSTITAYDSLVDKLDGAVCYTVSKTPSVDRFFVYDSTNNIVGNDNSLFGVGYGAYQTDVGATIPETHKNGIGQGKKTWNAVVAKGSGGGRPYTILTVLDTVGYNGGSKSANNGTGFNTIWSYCDYLNTGRDYSTMSPFAEVYAATPTKLPWKDKTINPGECADWYPGTPDEYFMLFTWARLVKYGTPTITTAHYYVGNFMASGVNATLISGARKDFRDKCHRGHVIRASYEKNGNTTVWSHIDYGTFIGQLTGADKQWGNCYSVAIRSF